MGIHIVQMSVINVKLKNNKNKNNCTTRQTNLKPNNTNEN